MSRQPDPIPSLRKMLDEIRRTLRRMQSASPFFGTGMHPNGDGGIDSDNFEAGVSGYSFKRDGNAEFNDLTLRGGIIGNDALTDPLEPLSIHSDATNFAVPGSFGTIMSSTIPVPSGFTQALILSLSVNASAINTSASTGWLYCSPKIVGFPGQGWSVGSADTPAGETAVAFDLSTRLLTGLSGSFVIQGQVSTNSASTWSASVANVANMDASILFLR